MKTTTSITRYFGFFILLVGLVLNAKMYFLAEPFNLMYVVLCFFGISILGTAYLMKFKK